MNRPELLDRRRAAELGAETVAILRDGFYTVNSGDRVRIAAAVDSAAERTRSYPPTTTIPMPPRSAAATVIDIVNETTLAAARRLASAGERPVALNFAAAVNAGGGFLSGATAQEESLVRSSGLFACINGNPMYAFHRENYDPIYSDYVLYSPDVPVFRTDDGELLDQPHLCAFITAAAPNAKALRLDNPGRAHELEPAFRVRIARVLAAGAAHGHETIILGAWGCGAFGNDPHLVARLFDEALSGPFKGVYRRAVFAITDSWRDQRTIGPFRKRLEGDPSGRSGDR